MDKELEKMRKMRESNKDWLALTKLITGSGNDGLAKQFDDLLESSIATMELPKKSDLPPPKKWSPVRKEIYLAACVAYTNLNLPGKGEKWCDEALDFVDVNYVGADGEGEESGRRKDEDVIDALIGKSEAHLSREEYEDAVRYLERAWDACGQSRQDVSVFYSFLCFVMD